MKYIKLEDDSNMDDQHVTLAKIVRSLPEFARKTAIPLLGLFFVMDLSSGFSASNFYILLALGVSIFIASIKIVPEERAYIVKRLWLDETALEPGLNFLIPWMDQIVKPLNLREQLLDLESFDVNDKDGNYFEIGNSSIKWHIVSALKFYRKDQASDTILEPLIKKIIRNIISQVETDCIWKIRSDNNLKNKINKVLEEQESGLKIQEFDLGTIRLKESNSRQQIMHKKDQPSQNISIGGNVCINANGSNVNLLSEISGNVSATLNQLPDNASTNQPSLKDLLQQLKDAIEQEESLSQEDKGDLLKQVKSIAQGSKLSDSEEKSSIARNAWKIFKSTLASCSDAGNLVSIFEKLWPMISDIMQ